MLLVALRIRHVPVMINFVFLLSHVITIRFFVNLFFGLSFYLIAFLGLIVFCVCLWYALCRDGYIHWLDILLSCFPPDDGS